MLLFLRVKLQQGCYGTHQLCSLWRREPIKQFLSLAKEEGQILLLEGNCTITTKQNVALIEVSCISHLSLSAGD